MNLKNKFHLTLVVLITLLNSIIGISPVDTANALSAVDKQNDSVYNLTKSPGDIYNIYKYNIYNNINIKYISIKLYSTNAYNQTHSKKIKLNSILSLKDKTEILMYSIKQVESHGRYKAKSHWSDACGAYQYMPITWNNYDGFRNACLAPEWVQDSKMRGEIKWGWSKYHDWEKVIASHFLPSYANNKKLWDTHWFKGQPTIRQYVQNVEQTMNSVVAGLATA
jgi:hypothetical protein